ncbi:hypothetical protein [Bradyrhizobium sp. CCBAU 51753]|uniref:hypothetical protein n=1 Tax=Bradyrhizobium sp. CCBAU 51753 TaxID=1325100 RepID=UPI00188CB15D|nr:hypothetical protein [Bradyrhizobium sp. CCBAU 51753]QOZ25335.1 hypothetical protein XH93_18340 [Bradyrhizobium sp. CCBAU 51753]
MTDFRPRTFCWIGGVRGPAPQILFDDPRVGCEGLQILASIRLEPTDTRSLDQLARDCPAPSVETI